MGFSRTAAFSFVPLLSRLVLAAAFIPAGYDKILGEPVVYTGEEAATLTRLGIGTPTDEEAMTTQVSQLTVYQETGRLRDRIRPRDTEPVPATPAPPRPRPPVQPVTPPVVEPEPEPEPEPIPEPEPVVEPEPEPEPLPEPPPVRVDMTPDPEFGEQEPVRARRLYRVSLMLVDNNAFFEKLKPAWLAWAAAGTELIGGGLLLLGLLSRIWALGLTITMGVAFYLTSLAPVMEAGPLALPLPLFNQVFTQMCLAIFALSIAMTGAGRLSIDGLLFGSPDEDGDHLLHLG